MTRAGLAWLLPALASAVLATQGWRGRHPTIDHVPLFDDARAAVRTGVLPRTSCLASYGAFLPPGPSWLAIPGAALGLDSRQLELPGALALHVLTSAGVWLLARRAFGPTAGAVAAWAYCWSDLGLFYASSLWPRGPACAAAWFGYFTLRWSADRRAAFLAAALVALSWGAVVFLELAPAAAALPFVWLRGRPPVAGRAWLWGAPLALLPWLPYAAFELPRGFADLRALVGRRSVELPDPRPFFCDRAAEVVDAVGRRLWPDPAPSGGASPAATAPSAGLPAGVRAGLRMNLPADAGPVRIAFAWALLALAFLGHRAAGGSAANAGAGALWRGLLVPWALLLAMAERDAAADRRFWWLWPLQAAALAGGVVELARRAGGGSRFAVPALAAGLVAAVATAGRPAERLRDWARNGYAGADAPAWTILETLAADARRRGRTDCSVSYSIHLWAHAFKFHPLDPRYRVGMEHDLALRDDLGMPNRERCPEGVRAGAEYVVEEKGLAARFAPRLGPDYECLAENEAFRLHARRGR